VGVDSGPKPVGWCVYNIISCLETVCVTRNLTKFTVKLSRANSRATWTTTSVLVVTAGGVEGGASQNAALFDVYLLDKDVSPRDCV
jgi:hypothetical protein